MKDFRRVCPTHGDWWGDYESECHLCLEDERAERNARDGYCGKGEYT